MLLFIARNAVNFLNLRRNVVEHIGASVFEDALKDACLGFHPDDALVLLNSIATDKIEDNEITASAVALIHLLLPQILRELCEIKDVIAALLPDYIAPVALSLGGEAVQVT
jgi:hypothetical protein